MSNLLNPADYAALQHLDLRLDGAIAKLLNRNGCANWTVCPHCSVDDFTHVEGCDLIPPMQEVEEDEGAEPSTVITPEQVTTLGEAAAKATQRALRLANKLGVDQNRGQFVSMVAAAITAIPPALRGEAAADFLTHEARNPYGAPRA